MEKTKIQLFRQPLLIQLIWISFGLCSLFFIYALGFFTNLVPTQDPFPTFYEYAQTFNKFLFNATFYMLILGLLVLMLKLQKITILHRVHYLLLIIWQVLIVVLSMMIIIRLGNVKEMYLGLDFADPNFTRFTPEGYTPSRFLFLFGWGLSTILILCAVFLLIQVFFQIKNEKKKRGQPDD